MSSANDTLDLPFSRPIPPGKNRLRGPNRGPHGSGMHRAPRSALQPGAVTRREWLRFLSFVTIEQPCLCTPDTPHVHWIWNGSLDSHGYGAFGWRGRNYAAYRFAHIALGGTIPDGYEPDHLCRNHLCCTVACLEIVTKAENNRRGNSICAQHARKTHCKHGHLLEGDNLYAPRLALGHRVCNACLHAKHVRVTEKRRALKALEPPKPLRTYCDEGHPLTDENVLAYELRKFGQRICRLCIRSRERARRKEKAEATSHERKL